MEENETMKREITIKLECKDNITLQNAMKTIRDLLSVLEEEHATTDEDKHLWITKTESTRPREEENE